MAIRSVGQLGPDLEDVIAAGDVWFDTLKHGDLATPQLGSTETDTEGNIRVFVKASALIAAAASPGTQVTITKPAFTAATGSGGYYAPATVAVPSGAYFWARKPA